MHGTVALIDSNIYDNGSGDNQVGTLQVPYDSAALNIINHGGILSIISSHVRGGMKLDAGSTTYVLPAPPGHWLPATKCEVLREDPGCKSHQSNCLAAAASCSMNTLDNVNPCNASTGSCMPVTANQPCD